MADDIRSLLENAMAADTAAPEVVTSDSAGVDLAEPPEAGDVVSASGDGSTAPSQGQGDDGSTPAQRVGERARGSDGKFAKETKAAKPAVTPRPVQGKPEATPAPVVATPTTTPPPATGDQSGTKPPADWSPSAREKWAGLPPEVQREAHRIHREVKSVLQESAPARKFHQEMQSVLAPHQQMMTANRMDPIAVTRDAMQMMATLHGGSHQNKAQLIAGVVKSFGIPIEALAAALDGQPQAQGGQGLDPSQIAAQVRQQVLQELQQSQAQRQSQKAAQEAEAFGNSHEFFNDVREDMADLIEVSHRRGVALSMEDAYNRACKMHPEVSKVFSQREAAEAAKANQASMQRARAAASSVHSQPAVPVARGQAKDVRGAIEASIASLSGRG